LSTGASTALLRMALARFTRLGPRTAALTVVLAIAVGVTACGSARPRSSPERLVSVGPLGGSFKLSPLPGAGPLDLISSTAAVLRVVGKRSVRIDAVRVLVTPSAADGSVAWTGIDHVTHNLASAVNLMAPTSQGPVSVAVRKRMRAVASQRLTNHGYYDLAIEVAAKQGYAPPWGLARVTVSYSFGRSRRYELKCPDDVTVQ
jgi:hypothetical protein